MKQFRGLVFLIVEKAPESLESGSQRRPAAAKLSWRRLCESCLGLLHAASAVAAASRCLSKARRSNSARSTKGHRPPGIGKKSESWQVMFVTATDRLEQALGAL
eukprot:s9735_g1.t1